MKKIFAIAIMMLLMAAGKSFSQSTPVVDERQQAQRARIRQGVNSGELTRPETRRVRAEQRHIRRAERRVKSDGQVTAGERARLNRKQNKTNRNIRREKHDRQESVN